MNKHRAIRNWKQLKGKIKEQWGNLTDDEINVIEGRKEMLLGKLREKYGITLEEAEKQFQEFQRQNLELKENYPTPP